MKNECLQQIEAMTHRFYQFQPWSCSKDVPMELDEP